MIEKILEYVDIPTLVCGAITCVGTCFYCIYDDWIPYRGYMRGFLYKNWAPRYECYMDGDHVLTNGKMPQYALADELFEERFWSCIYHDLENMHTHAGHTYYVKEIDFCPTHDIWTCRDDPWWWGLVHKYIMGDIYRRYEWVAFRKILVEWYYHLPLINKLMFNIHISDLNNPLPEFIKGCFWPPKSYVRYGNRGLYYIKKKDWKLIWILCNNRPNSNLLLPSPTKINSIDINVNKHLSIHKPKYIQKYLLLRKKAFGKYCYKFKDVDKKSIYGKYISKNRYYHYRKKCTNFGIVKIKLLNQYIDKKMNIWTLRSNADLINKKQHAFIYAKKKLIKRLNRAE